MAKCPECGTEVGPEAGVDVYKHLLACLHVPSIGVQNLMAQFSGRSDEYSKRVMALLRQVGGE